MAMLEPDDSFPTPIEHFDGGLPIVEGKGVDVMEEDLPSDATK